MLSSKPRDDTFASRACARSLTSVIPTLVYDSGSLRLLSSLLSQEVFLGERKCQVASEAVPRRW